MMDVTATFSSPLTWAAIAVSAIYSLYRFTFSFTLLKNTLTDKLFDGVTIRYGTSTYTYFSDQGIPGPKPLPFIGNMWGIWREVIKNGSVDFYSMKTLC